MTDFITSSIIHITHPCQVSLLRQFRCGENMHTHNAIRYVKAHARQALHKTQLGQFLYVVK